MFYVFESKYSNNASYVEDDGNLSNADKQRGIAIEKLPSKEEEEGKRAVLKANKSTEEVWWEYEDVIPTEEDMTKETISTLGQELATLKIQLIQGGIL